MKTLSTQVGRWMSIGVALCMLAGCSSLWLRSDDTAEKTLGAIDKQAAKDKNSPSAEANVPTKIAGGQDTRLVSHHYKPLSTVGSDEAELPVLNARLRAATSLSSQPPAGIISQPEMSADEPPPAPAAAAPSGPRSAPTARSTGKEVIALPAAMPPSRSMDLPPPQGLMTSSSPPPAAPPVPRAFTASKLPTPPASESQESEKPIALPPASNRPTSLASLRDMFDESATEEAPPAATAKAPDARPTDVSPAKEATSTSDQSSAKSLAALAKEAFQAPPPPAGIPEAPQSPAPAKDTATAAPAAASVPEKKTAAPAATEPLALENLAFCTQIFGFGDVEAVDANALTAGEKVLLYAEVCNFHSQLAGTNHETILRSEMLIETPDGVVVQPYDFGNLVDHCAVNRTDFFCHYTFALPESLAPGPYVLRLKVKDLGNGQQTHKTIDFVVGSPKPSN